MLEVGDDTRDYAGRLSEALAAGPRATAIIVSNSVVAARTLRVLQALGDAYPDRISLLAFEEPDWAELTSPQLSVIRQPVKAIAKEAWELLAAANAKRGVPCPAPGASAPRSNCAAPSDRLARERRRA